MTTNTDIVQLSDERITGIEVALDALDEYQRNWDTGLPVEYAQSERIAMECAVEAVREALNDARAAAPAAPAQSGEPVPVEVWHGDRKVTIYDDCVLRVWGTNIESEMSDVPRTLKTVQDALDWLYAAPQPAPPAREACQIDNFSGRVCQHGTQSCVADHASAQPTNGADHG